MSDVENPTPDEPSGEAPPAAAPSGATDKPRGPDGKFAPADGKATPTAAEAAPQPGAKPAASPATPATIASGSKEPAPAAKVEPTWPDDWRQRMARAYAGDDEKAFKKELKRLERVTDPLAVYGSYRELDSKFSEGGLVKIPGPKATEEDRAAYFKALGVPEEPKGYVDKLKLSGDRVLGENDRPAFDFIAQHAHKVGMTPAQMSAVTDAYLDFQVQAETQREVADAEYHDVSLDTLKKELGGSFDKVAGAIGSLFATAPAGVQDLLLNGRTADGKRFGDHPDVVKFLGNLALELNPAASVAGMSDTTVSGMRERRDAILNVMKTDRRSYDKNTAMQSELRDLNEAIAKQEARNRAA